MHIFKLIDWFKHRLADRETTEDFLDPPNIEGLIDGVEPGDPPFLPKGQWEYPLQVDIPKWLNSDPSPEFPETVTLFWDEQPPLNKSWSDEIPDYELFINVPVSYLSEGAHSLCYTVITANDENTPSEVLSIIIDKTPPALNSASSLVFDTEVTQNGVTDRWLRNHGEVLTARVPAYTTPQPGDVITFYWSYALSGTDPAGTYTLSKDDIGKPVDIEFPGLVIRNSKDGKRYASYKITDLTGNVSGLATPVELNVSVEPLIRSAPEIKHATGNGANWTLDPSRATNGATVIILPEAIAAGEAAFVQWDVPGSPGAYRIGTPDPDGSRDYKIPKDKVAFQIGKTFKVYYEVDGDSAPSAQSSVTINPLATGMPTLQCDSISAGKISLAYVQNEKGGYASFNLGAWPFMGSGQFVRVTVVGFGGGQTHRFAVFEEPVDRHSTSLPVGRISVTDLSKIDIGQTATLIAEVSFDQKLSWQPCHIPHPAPDITS